QSILHRVRVYNPLTMNTNNRSSRIAASCSPNDIWSSGGGRLAGGSCDASGGIEILDASGAVVGAISAASGFHGTTSHDTAISRHPHSSNPPTPHVTPNQSSLPKTSTPHQP